jgi:hypothetical protein
MAEVPALDVAGMIVCTMVFWFSIYLLFGGRI